MSGMNRCFGIISLRLVSMTPKQMQERSLERDFECLIPCTDIAFLCEHSYLVFPSCTTSLAVVVGSHLVSALVMFSTRPRYLELCRDIKASNFWKKMNGSGYDAVKRKSPPVELYVAASLSHLGTGHDFGSIEWHTGISRQRLLYFHHKFTKYYGNDCFDRYVCTPSGEDLEELQRLSQPYTLLGLPGAIASLDGVHIGSTARHPPSSAPLVRTPALVHSQPHKFLNFR